MQAIPQVWIGYPESYDTPDTCDGVGLRHEQLEIAVGVHAKAGEQL
jgi:hypothetical protein